MEEKETLAEDNADISCDVAEIRLKRLAYFQKVQLGKGQNPISDPRLNKTKQTYWKTQGTDSDRTPINIEKERTLTEISEYHLMVQTDQKESKRLTSSQSEEYISYNSKALQGNHPKGNPKRAKSYGNASSFSDDDTASLARPLSSSSNVNIKPSFTESIHQLSKSSAMDLDGSIAPGNLDIEQVTGKKVLKSTTDRHVQHLFGNKIQMSASEMPAHSLQNPADADSVSVLKNSSDRDDLDLSNHHHQNRMTSNGNTDIAARQRSISADRLLLGSKAEELKRLLGEQRYQEFVEKSENELNQLHKSRKTGQSSLPESGEDLRSIQNCLSNHRNSSSQPLETDKSEVSCTSRHEPTPGRQLRSSSPQMVTRTLQDIDRTKEIRRNVSPGNFDHIVIPRNVAFSADQIYQEAYGSGNNDSNGVATNLSSSVSSTHQNPLAPFWNTSTSQVSGNRSPSSSQEAPVFQTSFFPNSSMLPVHLTTTHPPAIYVGSPNNTRGYFFPHDGMANNTCGEGQFAYPRHQDVFMAASSRPAGCSPDSYLYQYHTQPLSQSMTTFLNAVGPHSPAGMALHYGPEQYLQRSAHHLIGHQTPGQGSIWKQFEHEGRHYSHSLNEESNLGQAFHPPVRDASKSTPESSKSSTEHAEKQHHELRRQLQEMHGSSSSQTLANHSAVSGDHYLASPRYLPPSHLPASHHVQPSPPSCHPLHNSQQPTDLQNSSDIQLEDDENNGGGDDEDVMSTVTRNSLATNESIQPEGLTERLERLGIDPIILQHLRYQSENSDADRKTLNAMKNFVRICPECQAVNKEYMTWCLQCGTVLIGVDTLPAKDLKKKSKGRKGADFHFKGEKFQKYPDKIKIIPIEVQHLDITEPFLEFEEKIEEITFSSIDDNEQANDSHESAHAQERASHRKSNLRESAEEVVVSAEEESESSMSQNVAYVVGAPFQHLSAVTENSKSDCPSRSEGPAFIKPQHSSCHMPENGPCRSEKEINDICGMIGDPIIRGFIKSYLQKKVINQGSDSSQVSGPGHGKENIYIANNPNPLSKPQSLGLGTNKKSSATRSSRTENVPAEKMAQSPKRKAPSKSSRKEDKEAVDVEIFAVENIKQCKNAHLSASVVPKLNLTNSSDEEEVLSETTKPGAMSDTQEPADYLAAINYSSDVKTIASEVSISEQNNITDQTQYYRPSQVYQHQEMANKNFRFLQQQMKIRQTTSPHQHKKIAESCSQPSFKPSSTSRPNSASKVYASIETPPPHRHWMRSSIAWSSYHPRELRTRSSINLHQSSVNGVNRHASGDVRACRSTTSLKDPGPVQMASKQRTRPASADQQHSFRKGANRGRPASAGRGSRPYSAGHLSVLLPWQQRQAAQSAGAGDRSVMDSCHPDLQNGNEPVDSPQSMNMDSEGRPIHRLPVVEDTLPLIPAGPSTALKIYDRCTEMTPRNELDQDSKWLFLPDELWLHVFTYLPQLDLFHITMTCKQLYRISLDPQLWRRVTVRKKSMQSEWLFEIAKRHPVSLAFVQCHGENLSENVLRDVFKEIAPKLKELNFSRCSKGQLIGDEILLHASTHCRHLTHVDASWCHVTDVGLIALAGCCHKLESLCLNGCQKISDESLKALVEKHGTSLRVLELFGCFSLTPASFRNLAEHCTFLLTLNIGQCYKISDSNMVTLSASLSRVETLDLRGCKKLGDNSIRKIVRNCRRLRHLILANCPLLSNAAVLEIATYSADIRSLDVCGCSNISDSSIRTLASNCYRLTSIDISSTSCTHRSVLVLAEFSRNLECAKFNFLADVHEKSLSKLIKNCKRLNTIHLYGCNVRDAVGLKRQGRFLNIEM